MHRLVPGVPHEKRPGIRRDGVERHLDGIACVKEGLEPSVGGCGDLVLAVAVVWNAAGPGLFFWAARQASKASGACCIRMGIQPKEVSSTGYSRLEIRRVAGAIAQAFPEEGAAGASSQRRKEEALLCLQERTAPYRFAQGQTARAQAYGAAEAAALLTAAWQGCPANWPNRCRPPVGWRRPEEYVTASQSEDGSPLMPRMGIRRTTAERFMLPDRGR
jgi:hypothetical protein